MKRVRKYAQQIGGQTIQDFIPSEEWTLEKNQSWIRRMREEGRLIVDIGPDFERRVRLWEEGKVPWSSAYNMERIELKGYTGHRKVFQRFGKWRGGVPGLDFD